MDGQGERESMKVCEETDTIMRYISLRKSQEKTSI